MIDYEPIQPDSGRPEQVDCQQPLDQRIYESKVSDQQELQARRDHLVGLLVYFPELRNLPVERSDLKDKQQETLYELLQPGDYEIIAGIPREEVDATRDKVAEQFKHDFPVGF